MSSIEFDTRTHLEAEARRYPSAYEDRVWRANKLRKLKIIVANIDQATAILKDSNDEHDKERK